MSTTICRIRWHTSFTFCLHVGETDRAEDPLCRVLTGLPCFFRFPGPIPEVLGSLTNLTKLRLGSNQLTGTPVVVYLGLFMVLSRR